MLITSGAPSVLANACYLVYNRATGTIGLYNNAATTLSTKPIGSSANLINSQCAVGFTVMVTSGNSVSFTINIVFLSFSGAKISVPAGQRAEHQLRMGAAGRVDGTIEVILSTCPSTKTASKRSKSMSSAWASNGAAWR